MKKERIAFISAIVVLALYSAGLTWKVASLEKRFRPIESWYIEVRSNFERLSESLDQTFDPYRDEDLSKGSRKYGGGRYDY